MWSDDRLTERFDRIDQRFDQVDARFDRVEARLDRLEADVRDLRREMHAGFAQIQRQMFHGAIALAVGYLGLAAALVARGF